MRSPNGCFKRCFLLFHLEEEALFPWEMHCQKLHVVGTTRHVEHEEPPRNLGRPDVPGVDVILDLAARLLRIFSFCVPWNQLFAKLQGTAGGVLQSVMYVACCDCLPCSQYTRPQESARPVATLHTRPARMAEGIIKPAGIRSTAQPPPLASAAFSHARFARFFI